MSRRLRPDESQAVAGRVAVKVAAAWPKALRPALSSVRGRQGLIDVFDFVVHLTFGFLDEEASCCHCSSEMGEHVIR
jgi:hypothetical protein